MGKGRANIEYFNSIGQIPPFAVATEPSGERPLRRPHKAPPPPPHRRLVAAPAARWRCCLPVCTKRSHSCVPAVAPKCGSSPSSPIRPPSATSSSTSASRPRHPASRRPAARRGGTCPMPGGVTATPTPSRHPSRVRSTHHLVTPTSTAVRARRRAGACPRPPARAANPLPLEQHPRSVLPGPRSDPSSPQLPVGPGRSGACFAASDDETGVLDLLSRSGRTAVGGIECGLA